MGCGSLVWTEKGNDTLLRPRQEPNSLVTGPPAPSQRTILPLRWNSPSFSFVAFGYPSITTGCGANEIEYLHDAFTSSQRNARGPCHPRVID